MADTCGSYRTNGDCGDILMSEVLGESAGAFCVKMCVAALLGCVVGIQREFGYLIGHFFTGEPLAPSPVRRAGLRTHMLVALGACLFSEASWSLFSVPVPAQATVDGERTAFVSGTFNYDTSRVAAQIVSGIGFLGAGTIHKSGDAVFGLTTAASLWTTAAVGTHVGGPNQKDPYFLAPTFATLLIVVTLQALIHLENVVHMANRKRTGRHQRASCVCAVFPHQDPGACVRSVVESVETRVGKVVSVGAAVGCKPTASQPPPHDNTSNTWDVKLGHHPDQTKRFVEVTITAVVPPTMGGVDLLECLLSTRSVASARVDESRRAHVGEPSSGGAARDGADAGVDAAGVDGTTGEGADGGGDGGSSALGAWFLGWGGGKRHGGAATLEDVDPTDWDAPLLRQ